MASKPLYETTSILRYLNSPGQDIFTRTYRYADLYHAAKADHIYPFRLTCLARKQSKVLVKTENGDTKRVIDAASNDYLM